MSIDLRFGYRQLPEGVETVWGARWIIDQGGTVDQVWDRTDTCGTKENRDRLLAHLSSAVGRKPFDALSMKLRQFELGTREDKEVVLYTDDVVTVVGSPQSSAGYFYVAAYLNSEVTDG